MKIYKFSIRNIYKLTLSTMRTAYFIREIMYKRNFEKPHT